MVQDEEFLSRPFADEWSVWVRVGPWPAQSRSGGPSLLLLLEHEPLHECFVWGSGEDGLLVEKPEEAALLHALGVASGGTDTWNDNGK